LEIEAAPQHARRVMDATPGGGYLQAAAGVAK